LQIARWPTQFRQVFAARDAKLLDTRKRCSYSHRSAFSQTTLSSNSIEDRMKFQRIAILSCAVFILFAQRSHADTLPIQVLSATIKDQRIADATVIVQKNGTPSITGATNANGQAQLVTDYDDTADSLIIIKKEGYSNLVARCPCKGLTYAISPVMTTLDGMRIVLTWGSTPADLDSHIVYPGNNIYWHDRRGADANLDVDDTDGYGPETITLEKKHAGETYVYAVHDYTNRTIPGIDQLSRSQAKVFVYVGQSLVRTYYVPVGQGGNLWTVFRVTGEGEFQDINTISGGRVEAEHVLDSVAGYTSESRHVVAANQSLADPVRAQALNRQGEQAFHAGNLDTSIDLYKQAIELDPNYGQAYSNLGLAYQTANRQAEAIWASRKAIALATGPTAATVRASSYYNIGRMYEAAKQYADALHSYQQAKGEKANTVYDNAIKRVSAQQ
jgi:TPR repeat/Tetratricopeptide repeat